MFVRVMAALPLAGTLVLGGHAGGQDTNAVPTFGSTDLESGFTPDPLVVEIRPGGPDAVGDLGTGCTGFINNARPDYSVNFVAGVYQLGFYVTGDADTTLVVNDPTGTWHCNDDHSSAGGVNPGIAFAEPETGRYDIWVGTFAAEAPDEPVSLLVTENTAPWAPRYGAVELAADFTPDPHAASVRAGGSDAAAEAAEGCAGFVSLGKPDYTLSYTAGQFRLGIFLDGDADTTLLVLDPSGAWHCDDDFSEAGGANPGLVFDDPADGDYQIWAGVFNQGDSDAEATLLITERGAPWPDDGGTATPGTTAVSSGTGFFVSDSGHVLTNQHVIDGCTRTTVQVRGQGEFEAVVLASNTDVDLALLQAENRPTATAAFRGRRSVRLGEEVVVYGFPLLGDLSSQGNLTVGIVSAMSGLDDDLSRMQLSAQIQPGNSGGPVMDRQGNIVGVVVESANDEYFVDKVGAVPQNVNFAIRDSLARSFLDTNNVPYRVVDATEPIPIVDIAEQAQDFTGVIVCYQ